MATVRMPNSWAERNTRMAISLRLAARILLMGRTAGVETTEAPGMSGTRRSDIGSSLSYGLSAPRPCFRCDSRRRACALDRRQIPPSTVGQIRLNRPLHDCQELGILAKFHGVVLQFPVQDPQRCLNRFEVTPTGGVRQQCLDLRSHFFGVR